MKLLRHLYIIFLLLATCGYGQGFLKTKGQQIVNEKGETVLLRGMGLGGWMLQEGYMFRLGNIGQQYRIKTKIEEVVGPEKTQQFYDQWLLQHTTKADVDSMAAWGFNSLRLPMHFGLYTLPVDKEPVKDANTWLEKGFAMTDSLLSWCKTNKIYLILDMHAAPGGQGHDLPISDRDSSKPSLWESEANQKKMIALWHKLAQRYANEPWIGGYDIINEPNWGFDDAKDVRGTEEKNNIPLRKLMMDISKTIREVDKKHIIIIEGNGFGNNYNGVLPAWDDNMVLSFHKYGNFNTEVQIKRFLDLREKYNLPLWLGESGENSNTWFNEAIRLAESYGIGWAWWQEKKMGINNPLEIKIPKGYDKLLDYWSGKGAKPAAAEAWSILQELLNNISIGQNIYHTDVIDAMFRQTNSTATKPFKEHVIHDSIRIPAIDYDLGRQRFAYYDRDSARYQYTPGVNTVGNKGRTYRNDGVDIQHGNEGDFVFSIEDGEWVQYTVTVDQPGNYTISLVVAADGNGGQFSISDNGEQIIAGQAVPITGSLQNWQLVPVKDISLNKGVHSFRVYADKGGFVFSHIQFVKQK